MIFQKDADTVFLTGDRNHSANRQHLKIDKLSYSMKRNWLILLRRTQAKKELQISF